ncbi:MAG: hypothetical protein IE884_05490 [Sulfuricurvum sp.]|nr:hypothetical protein [Sulfuricurvum sp.]
MKQVINLYKKHKITVDGYIETLIKSFPDDYMAHSVEILKTHHFIQLIYGVDEEFRQQTPIVCRREKDAKHIGSDKRHYFAKMELNHNGFYISNPYIHYRTGKASLSVVRYIGNHYYVFDINLIEILEELRLIEYNRMYDKFRRGVYFIGATLLALVSIALIGYGGYIFFKIMLAFGDVNFLHDVFKSIIAITLGLAIYDLAKQIFEHEVIYESFYHPEDKQYKVLGKFIISIVIALSIETLMVVFKIALDDYSNMGSAFYLMIGTTLMFTALGYFYKKINSVPVKEENE